MSRLDGLRLDCRNMVPRLTLMLVLFASIVVSADPLAIGSEVVSCWEPFEIPLTAAEEHAWSDFPVRVTFSQPGDSRSSCVVEAFWDGDKQWVVRAALPKPGIWAWHTESDDDGLNANSGSVEVVAPTAAQIAANPNLRGQLRIAEDQRHFQYADGTPLFLLADTLWAGNTARCGLGANKDGPFFQHLADRKNKGFTSILMQYFHGYGDYPDSPGHRNEGGKPYLDITTKQLNPAHFQSLDVRMRALWDRGFVAAIPATWWGKTNNCVFTPEDAWRMSAYCAVRYGAFNSIWSLSGEYQYAFKDCGWTPADFTLMGEEVQRHNPLRHPLSIHPSGRIDWPSPHNVQSSKPFHGQSWLDHHWLQTGQSVDRMFNIVTRLAENRALDPAMPVFCSESYYERADDPDSAYHTRWQIWTAMLNGAAGFGYGAQGVWQFLDPADPEGESGKRTSESVPWREAARLPGSAQVGHARTLLESLPWWQLQPRRDALLVNGKPNPLPTRSDLRPPQAASIGESTWIIYLPRGNVDRTITLAALAEQSRTGQWFDPRTGRIASGDLVVPAGVLPTVPSDDDWVFVIHSGLLRVPSPVIDRIELDWTSHRRLAEGSDNWPTTWADDGNLYTAWGDGGGFGGSNSQGRVTLGVARVKGGAANYSGTNVWGGYQSEHAAQFGGKSYGILSVDGVLYMWVVPQPGPHLRECRMACSTDHGATWQRADWAFRFQDGLTIPTFLNFGRDNAGARDPFVYSYFIEPKWGPERPAESKYGFDVHCPGHIHLTRVPHDAMLDRDRYEFFAGWDQSRKPRWSANVADKQAVFRDDNGVGWNLSVSFNAGLHRYLLATEHSETHAGKFGLFDAPEPWGPWTTVAYDDRWGAGQIEVSAFYWNFPAKWQSPDGRRVTMVFTGKNSNDSWNTVKGTFLLRRARQP